MGYFSVAIDGPSAAGKTTMSRLLAAELGFTYVDTGAMYRAIGLYVLNNSIDPKDPSSVENHLNNIKIEIKNVSGTQRVFLCGRDVTAELRSEPVSAYASAVSAVPAVRAFLLNLQRDFAQKGNVIMEGRDIGSVVLPNADIKIFLTATSEIRAKRRVLDLAAKGESADFDTVHKAMIERDYNDSTRTAAPLRPSLDGIIFDTTHLTKCRVLASIIEIIKEKACV